MCDADDAGGWIAGLASELHAIERAILRAGDIETKRARNFWARVIHDQINAAQIEAVAARNGQRAAIVRSTGVHDDAIASAVVDVAGQADRRAVRSDRAPFIAAGNAELHGDMCAGAAGVSAADCGPAAVDGTECAISTIQDAIASDVVAVRPDPKFHRASEDQWHL